MKLKVGDVVRVLGVPDLSGMSPAARRDCEPVFRHIVGTYRRISGFDDHGRVEIALRISSGPKKGRHFVWLEPELVRVRRSHR